MAHKRQLYHPRQDKSKHLLQIEQGGLGTNSLSEAADNFGLLKNKDLDIPNGAAVVGVTGMITKDRIEGGEILPGVPIVNGPVMVRAGEPYEYVISNYDSFTEYTLTSRNGTAVLSGDKVIFTGEYPGDASFTLNEVKYPITIGNLVIGQPAILSPVNGSIRIEIELTAKSSSFSSSGAADTHRSSDWQISKTADFSDIAKESYQDPINPTEWDIEGLEYEKKYYVRTRHYGAAPGPGPWSNVVEFTTRPEAYVLEPQIQYPSYGEQDVSRLPTLITSPLYVFKGTDLHVSTDWEISSNDTFTNLIASSQDDQVNKTTWAPPRLPNDSMLYLRARHKGAVLDKGDWSLTTMFKTVNVIFQNPSITSPTENATTPTVTVTVSGSAFTVAGEVDNHVSTDWQISKNSSFSPVLYASENDTVNKTSWTPPKLESNTTYYVRARYRSGLNGYSGWTPTRVFKSVTVTIAAPSVISPANGTMDAPLRPTISSSAFSITGDSDTHRASDWQISTSSDFSAVVQSSIGDTVNKTSWTPIQKLNPETVYYVRVRYEGVNNGYGTWSASRAFKTTAVTVATPSIVSPNEGLTLQSNSVVLNSSAFSVTGDTDTHLSTDWQVSTNASFTNLVVNSVDNTSSKDALAVNGLAYGTTYYARVRHKSATYGTSQWSGTRTFISKAISAPIVSALNIGHYYPTGEYGSDFLDVIALTYPYGIDASSSELELDLSNETKSVWFIDSGSYISSVKRTYSALSGSLFGKFQFQIYSNGGIGGGVGEVRHYKSGRVRIRHYINGYGWTNWSSWTYCDIDK